ncbi:flagellar assembly factor FliW [Paenibacillus forsythiae]|uniref:Flagellar assembly factor FliW n=1 Tax=Paenibacillus forsythiae TaxID=365616 RepID=A0ABU3HD89_9BACL|nr:flagellar assembly protein FliW [Paenibacillus forsythiae]MDT3428012.1 flagellar assembly factor FliW [Paenibacillus forsythiae]
MANSLQNEIEVSEDQVFVFNKGIPGFEDFKQFTIYNHDEHFSFLQSVDDDQLAFIIINPFLFFANYEFELNPLDMEELLIKDENEIAVRSIVTWGSDTEVTANLMAPLVFNVKQNLGKQVVLNKTVYTTKHLLLSNNRKIGDGEDLC